MNLKPFFNGVWKWTKRNSTKLLAAGAITAEALGFWFMHKEAPVVRDRLEELGPDAKWYEKVKVAGPVYLPAIGMLALSVGCIIGGCAMGEKKAAIMASLYSASEASLRRLEEKVVKEIGPEKAQEIHDKIADELVEKAPPTPENIEYTGNGGELFWEPWTGRWFASSMKAFDTANERFIGLIQSKMWASMNDWYELQGLKPAESGDIVGWNVDHVQKHLRFYTRGDERSNDRELYHIVFYSLRPVLWTGKEPRAFSESDSCYPDEY